MGGGDFDRDLVLEEEAGLIPVHVTRRGDAVRVAGVDGIYLYAPGKDCDYRARKFSPTAGIPEDPANGTAGATLSAQLLASGTLGEGETRLTLHQGVEMGRPGVIGLTTVVRAGALAEERIAGSAVPMSEGRVRVPE
jgi:trans-2,3-dihydro-3-hydroxyanthranilate isomerase